MLPLTGYTNKFSAQPGESLDFKVSSEADYSARLVRIISGDPNPNGPGMHYELIEDASFPQETYKGRSQSIAMGSYGITAPDPLPNSLKCLNVFSMSVTIFPTLASHASQQAILSRLNQWTGAGFVLGISSKGSYLHVSGKDDETVCLQVDKPLHSRVWYKLKVTLDYMSGMATLYQEPLSSRYGVDESGDASHEWPDGDGIYAEDFASAPFVIAARAAKDNTMTDHFNGKIESPTIRCGDDKNEELVVGWDFALKGSMTRAMDTGPHNVHLELINLPTRGVTGSTWSGREQCWRHSPSEYAAIHFHEDDLSDCHWETDFVYHVPETAKSGVYGALLTLLPTSSDDESDPVEEIIPFYIRPKKGRPTSDTVFLAPTFTYQIYANHQRPNAQEADYQQRVQDWKDARTWHPNDHPEYGASTYNLHSDGSGICYSSRLRPILTMRPGFVTFCDAPGGSGLRHFPADTHILSWLHAMGKDFDVITDEDLHNEGYDLIQPYKVVMTGSHPEYHTLQTLDALQSYVDSPATDGEHYLMYLGGNGFYWRIAADDSSPGLLEIRRGEGGVRMWASEPGEYYNTLDGGSYGGLWRRNGRPPQQLVGVGFSSQGKFSHASYYDMLPASHNDASNVVSWIFDGIEHNVPLGDFGLSGCGAAGYELDRVDFHLGSPPNTIVLATSQDNHDETYFNVHEEMLTDVLCTTGGSRPKDLVRADMAYFETWSGAVFSTGSITFCGSLPHNNFDNNISRILQNLFKRWTGHDCGKTRDNSEEAQKT